jgi:hypothetical protein
MKSNIAHGRQSEFNVKLLSATPPRGFDHREYKRVTKTEAKPLMANVSPFILLLVMFS